MDASRASELSPDFPAKETAGKETSPCPGGDQQVAENGGNERAVPRVFVRPVDAPDLTEDHQEQLRFAARFRARVLPRLTGTQMPRIVRGIV